MEVSLMRRQSTVAKSDLFPIGNPRFLESRRRIRPSRIGFRSATWMYRKAAVQVVRKAVRSDMAVEETESPARQMPADPVRLFVGLPLDTISDKNTVNHGKAIAAGLRALKLLGAQGVEVPVWWGVAQPDSPAHFDWSAYLALARAIRDAGLRLRVSLHLHAGAAAPLPAWVSRAAASNPDILFTDRSGRRYPGCLSLAVDDLPVLDGITPMHAFENFFFSFRSAFSDLIGSTITEISVGLGPDGELRYPSFPTATGSSRFSGVGEFQCYDKYMLDSLKKHAEAAGNPFWGLSGPHDTPEYSQSPESNTFFKEHGGSWETPYGNFFLSWYSGQLLSHGDRILSIASKVFGDLPVRLSGKIPLLHWWHNTRSRPAELTAGFFNTNGKDGYNAIAELFSKNSCAIVVPGMDLADRDQPQGLRSSPESLLSQIMRACERHGVPVSGENSSLVGGSGAAGLSRIKDNLTDEGSRVDSFTYQRMGAYFFSPEHWPRFTEFVRSLALPELDADDLVSNEEERVSLPMGAVTGRDREMQAV